MGVVLEPFPLGPLYQVAARRHDIDLRFVDEVAFCADPVRVVTETLAGDCKPIAFAVPAETCPGQRAPLGWPAPGAVVEDALYAFPGACHVPIVRPIEAAEVVALDQ